MPESDDLRRIWNELDRINKELSAVTQSVRALSPEDAALMQVRVAVLEANFVNLKEHLESISKNTSLGMDNVWKQMSTKVEARIPHLLIYGISSVVLVAFIWAIIAQVFIRGVPPHP